MVEPLCKEAIDPVQLGVYGLNINIDAHTEIVFIHKVEGLIFVIAKSGLCVAFDRVSSTRVAVLNQEREEKIRKLQYNEYDASILAVSTLEVSARCCSIPLQMVKTGNVQFRKDVFGPLNVALFVNCHNGLAVVRNVQWTYDIFDLRDYSLLYSLTDLHYVEGVQTSPEMIFIWRQEERHVHKLRVHSIRDGALIEEFLLPADEVTASCVVKEHLLYNDESGNSNLLDMCSSKVRRLQSNKLKTAQYKCLPRSNLLLAREHHRRYSVWELSIEEVKRKKGKKDKKKLVRQAEEIELLCQGPYTVSQGTKGVNVLVIHEESIVLSYYKPADGSSRGSISVTDIRSGKLVCNIADNAPPGPGQGPNITQILDSVCTMCYDEENEELYTGTTDGGFQIWAS